MLYNKGQLHDKLQPSKAHGRSSGLSTSLINIQPMDWISTDICEKVLSYGKKYTFLVIVDRPSGFISAY